MRTPAKDRNIASTPRPVVICLLLVVITLGIYSSVRNNIWINYDDGAYLVDNPRVQAGLTWEGVGWAFTTGHASNWHPLTWISHMLDCQIFGMDLGWHHLMSVCIHAINGALLFLLLLRMTDEFWKSAFVAALFAWHPLRVESVAWLSERKDVLCAFFGLLTLLAYVRYAQGGRRSKVEGRAEGALTPSLSHRMGEGARRAGEGSGRPPSTFSALAPRHSSLDYLLVLVFFALGLMSKPMLVTLPFILLLLDYWPLRRFRELPLSRLVVEKLPFLLLSAASCAVTFVAQSREHSVAPLERIPMDLRFENAAVSYVGYLFKLVWPTHLSVIYPFPKQIPWTLWLPAVIVLLFISWLVWRARGRKPQWLVGWYWYLGMTVPVIGLVQVGAQSMADRYTYLPLIGVAVALTFGISIPNTFPRLGRAMRIALPSLILAGCLVGTGIQLRHWRDSESLFNHALAVTEENSVAHSNLATVLFREGRMDDALPHLRKAIELDRYDTEARMKLAVVLLRKGQVDEAIELSRVAAQMRPDSAPAQYNLGNALLQKGSLEEAITQFQKALELQPDFVDADNNLGSALLRSDRAAQAIPYFQKVLETRPGDAKAQSNLAVGLMQVGKVEEALKYFRQTAELGPRNKSAHNNLAKALLQIGRQDEASVEFQRVVEIDPQDAETWGRLGMIYLGKHHLPEAIESFDRVLELQPDNVQVLNDSAWILATCPDGSVRNGAQAVEWAARASGLTKGSNPAILATLAAAYAEAGRFNEAVEISRKVLELMSGARDSAKVEELQHRLEQYQAGAAYRDPGLR